MRKINRRLEALNALADGFGLVEAMKVADTRLIPVWHDNVLAVVKFHKEHCYTSECGCSMRLLRMMAEQAGVVFTDEEKQVFF